VRPAVVLGANLVVGAGVLAYVLVRYGSPAVHLLATRTDPLLLAAFPLAVGASVLAYALRWRILLRGVGASASLGWLTTYRLAGQSLSSLIPSAKLGGEPLRVVLLVRDGVPAPAAIASVVVDRTLEMGAAAGCAILYAIILLRRGVPELEGALATVTLGGVALAIGIAVSVGRLRRGAGLASAAARRIGLDRLPVVAGRMDALEAAEGDVARLVAAPRRIAWAFAAGMLASVFVLAEYALLLAAFGLPASPLAIVAAIFATGAAHSLPVPAAVGALEGAQMWLFGVLGHPPEVGLAVGLAVRLRELAWIVPGLVYLMGRGVTRLGSPAWRRAGATS